MYDEVVNIPLQKIRKRHTYILNDEDVLGYLLEGNKNHRRDVLHVEIIEGVSGNQSCKQISIEDQGSGIY